MIRRTDPEIPQQVLILKKVHKFANIKIKLYLCRKNMNYDDCHL